MSEIDAETISQLIAAFTTIIFIYGLGFSIQRLQPFSTEMLTQLSKLVIQILLPLYLFYVTASTTSVETLSVAPRLIAAGVVAPLLGYILATVVLKPAAVAERQRTTFQFSIMVANTAFLGIPICQALYGTVGAVYAVLYDFGTALIVLTFGIWVISGGRRDNWQALFLNPIIWGMILGLGWAIAGWTFPQWLASPLETLGDLTMPLALLVGGASLASIRPTELEWRQLLAGLISARLVVIPLIVAGLFLLLGWDDLAANVTIIQAAMPLGLATVMFVESYGADGPFAAAATLWSTLFTIISLPLIVFFLLS